MVEAVDKRRARLNCISHFLSQIPYQEVEQDGQLAGAGAQSRLYSQPGSGRHVRAGRLLTSPGAMALGSGVGQRGDLLGVSDRGGRAGRLGEQVERLVIVLADRASAPGPYSRAPGIAGDGPLQQAKPRDRPDEDDVLGDRVPGEARPEDPRRSRAASRAGVPTDASAGGCRPAADGRSRGGTVVAKVSRSLRQAAERHAGRRRAAQQRLHVLRRVVERPRLAIDRLPLLPGSSADARCRRARRRSC